MKLAHPHAPGPRHPAEVVAPEVDQHDVLGALLGVGEELLGQPLVAGRVHAARPGAGDRAGSRAPALLAHQHLGRGADQRHVGRLEQHHVRARVDHAQRAVERQRIDRGAARSSGAPAPPGRCRRRRCTPWRCARRLRKVGAVEARRWPWRRPGRLLGHGDAAAAGLRRSAASRAARAGARPRAIDLALDLVGDREHPLAGVVEDDQGVEAGEQRDRQAEGIGGPVRQPLDQADQVVAEVARPSRR